MPKYTLTYFEGRGRAEISRLLFAVAGVEYENNAISFAEWGGIKGKTSFGVLPSLQVDGAPIAMSPAIANYLAREFGLHGKTNTECTRIDTICCALADVMDLLFGYLFAKEDSKEACRDKYSKKAESCGVSLEAYLNENGGDGFFVGTGLTLADVAFFNSFSEIINHKPDALDNTPKLKALLARVGANEKIAHWVKIRPNTPF